MSQDNNNDKFFDRSNIEDMFNGDFVQEKKDNVFFDKSVLTNVSSSIDGQNNDNGFNAQEVDANKANEQQYQYIIDNAKKNDVYWDRNNIFVKAVLIALFSFAFVGTICFLLLWFTGE